MNLWDRQPKESAEAYQALRHYLALGSDRSHSAVAQKHSKSIATLAKWSVRWKWSERARAYDDHMVAVEQQAREQALADEAAKWAKRQAELREIEWQRVTKITDLILEALNQPFLLDSITPKSLSELTSALEKASKIGRLATEMATERTQHNIDWSQLSDEQVARLAAGEPPEKVLRS